MRQFERPPALSDGEARRYLIRHAEELDAAFSILERSLEAAKANDVTSGELMIEASKAERRIIEVRASVERLREGLYELAVRELGVPWANTLVPEIEWKE